MTQSLRPVVLCGPRPELQLGHHRVSPPARRGTFFVGITGNQGTTFLAHFSAVLSDRFRVYTFSARPLTAAGA